MASPKPCSSVLGVLVFIPLVLILWTTAFLLQLVVAVLILPVLALQGGREKFHHIQSYIFHTASALVVYLNPLWRVRLLHEAGDNRPMASRAGASAFDAMSCCGLSRGAAPSQVRLANEEGSIQSTGPTGSKPGSVIFVNHRSGLDPFVVAWVLMHTCKQARFLYKASIGYIPIGGWAIQLTGDLPVHFGKKEAIKNLVDRSRELLLQGYNIMVFPEGTRSPSGILQDLKMTYFDLCAETGAAAVPITLLGAEKAWPLGAFRIGCTGMTAVHGQPLLAGQGADAGERLRAEVEEAFYRLARQAVAEGAADDTDPLITKAPYSWWTPSKNLEDLGNEQLLSLLRSGKTHEAGTTSLAGNVAKP